MGLLDCYKNGVKAFTNNCKTICSSTISRMQILKLTVVCVLIIFIFYVSNIKTFTSSYTQPYPERARIVKIETRPCTNVKLSGSESRNLLTFYGHESLLKSPEAFRPRNVKLSPLNYNFTINSPPPCPSTSNNPTLFILILTQHDAYNQRKAIRDTWGRIARHEPWPGRRLLGEVRLIFLLAAIDNAPLNKAVQNEASEHKDIVEANFKDSYFNLTLKVLMGIKWVRTYCPNTKYIMKIDHDALVDIPRIVNLLVSTYMHNGIYGPFSYSEMVSRGGRGAVARTAYQPMWYPPHVKGNSYIIPYPLAVKIMNVSEYFPYVNIEDAYITGVLAKVFDARHIEIPDDQYEKYPTSDVDVCAFVLEKKLAAQKVYAELLYKVWERIEKPELCGVVAASSAVSRSRRHYS